MGAEELRSALERASEVDLTVTGRRSGRQITIPVWFVAESDTLYLVPVSGTESDWYRNVRKTPTIGLAAAGAEATATATPIADAAKVDDVVEKFRAKYGAGQVKQYYSKLDAAVEVPLG